jgi:uncharacterized protein YciI
MKKSTLLAAAAALSFFYGLARSEPAQPSTAAPAARFDHVVRNDFFAGFNGDAAALERGMKVTEQVLAAQPDHAEAMVWHGSGMFFLSGRFFQQGDSQKGMEFWTKSLAMMDRAVELAPANVGVRIPRGAVLLSASRFVPPDMRKQLLDRAFSDYNHSFELQKDRIATMPTHPKGELLSGLAEMHELSGRAPESKALLQQIVREMAGSPYSRRAEKWLAEGMPAPAQRNCIGCHTPSN